MPRNYLSVSLTDCAANKVVMRPKPENISRKKMSTTAPPPPNWWKHFSAELKYNSRVLCIFSLNFSLRSRSWCPPQGGECTRTCVQRPLIADRIVAFYGINGDDMVQISVAVGDAEDKSERKKPMGKGHLSNGFNFCKGIRICMLWNLNCEWFVHESNVDEARWFCKSSAYSGNMWFFSTLILCYPPSLAISMYKESHRNVLEVLRLIFTTE